MTTLTVPDTGHTTGGGLHGAIAAEWTKLWSVRSTWWSLTASVVLTLGYTVLTAISVRVQADDGSEALQMGAPEIAASAVFYLAQFTVLAWATMTIAGEYGTGSIRSTLQWVPVRTRMLLAKLTVLAPILCVLGVVLGATSTGLAALTMGGAGTPSDFGDAVEMSLAIAVYCALLGALTLGIGTALRSVAGTITMTFMLLLVVPMLLAAIGLRAAGDYLPGLAGLNLMFGQDGINPITGMPSPYPQAVALVVLAAWALLALGVGATLLRRRDA
ncbi:ABC-type transport system involved in multi-copper enzyme maturation, permease component [Amycolatopsis marina]|uniref:ABC-type transport system involved in multi-copper enzyme maturation, permease component n=1 Tax=Amycolatopsis marina TaxID=490629 RepID=A0A1I1CMI6_9PSEU|nr:hypothetical protein [Amycolatopsis marina]SFB61633.1 ABC-type transport system involved in multi-copper enzyme maturation, permease component [Amycolatopsis marina]